MCVDVVFLCAYCVCVDMVFLCGDVMFLCGDVMCVDVVCGFTWHVCFDMICLYKLRVYMTCIHDLCEMGVCKRVGANILCVGVCAKMCASHATH